ncbi:MAG TPA: zf-HC2 domain-containing protein [Sedimentisphaerales bacterium]|nr:zf-HC2 domain-containing protein [Sedimentisphaerales bacterium]
MNTHEQINEMLPGYALGELADRQSSEVEAHLAECQDCGGEVKRLKTLIESAARMSELSADERTCESAKQALFETIVTKEIKEPTLRPNIGLEFLWRTIMKTKMTKLAAAAVIVLGACLGLHFIGGPDMANVALGEVTSRAAQVDYVHFYMVASRDSDLGMRQEGWYAHGKMVIRGNYGGMIYDDGQTQQSFDEQGRRTIKKPSAFPEGQTVFELFSGGLLSDENEQLNQLTPINVGDDFLIYEFDPPAGSNKWLECISITVGKNSLLPVQIKIYEKDSDDYELVMFDYEAAEKPAEFFEPPAVDAPHGRAEVLLDGQETVIHLEGAPGLKQAIVRLYDKYDGPSDQFPLDYIRSDQQPAEFCRAVSKRLRREYQKNGGPIFRLDASFVTDEGYRSITNDLLALGLDEAKQCGVGADNWPDGKYRNIRFSPMIKPTGREDAYIVEISCWLRTEKEVF